MLNISVVVIRSPSMANDVNLPLILYHLDLKLGISEKSIFYVFHPDAEDLLNVICDFKLVCEKLRDRSQRHKHQVAQFLVGLAEPPAPNTAPRRFISFCRVRTVVSDEERNTIVTHFYEMSLNLEWKASYLYLNSFSEVIQYGYESFQFFENFSMPFNT